MSDLIRDLKSTLGEVAVSSSCGGGAGSILMVHFTNHMSVRGWRYWEIFRNNELLACSEDDPTPYVGVMPAAARRIEGMILQGFTVFDDYTLTLYFEDNIELFLYGHDLVMAGYDDSDMTYWEVYNENLKRNIFLDNHRRLSVEFEKSESK